MTRDASRREFLQAAAAMSAAIGLAAGRPASAQGPPLRPTPACADAGPTPRQTAGPFFKPNSPRRTSLLEPGLGGTKIVVTGVVRFTDCRPAVGALLDVWHADDRGDYDNAGDRLRGHQVTDDQGRYRFETIVPGRYPGRTRHFHVKVQAPGGPVLTTQLYFPGEPGNQSDALFDSDLLMQVRDGEGAKLAGFDFVLGSDRT